MKNVITYKWQIIGSVLVNGETHLQHILNQLEYVLDIPEKIIEAIPGKIRTHLLPYLNRQRTFLYGKFRNIQRTQTAPSEKESTLPESNHIEGQSL